MTGRRSQGAGSRGQGAGSREQGAEEQGSGGAEGREMKVKGGVVHTVER